jgi:hypothetical protein
MPNDSHSFERLAYRAGQLLTAHDLREQKSNEDRLRWLHVVGLHGTWGIVWGLTVSGNIGDRMLTVAPGYAVDQQGRDLPVAGEMKIPLPVVVEPATLVLTLSYKRDAEFRQYSQLLQVCLGEGGSRPLEQPLFSWRQPTEVCFSSEIPLVKVEVVGGALANFLDLRARRYTRRESIPTIGWGNTEPGTTGWKTEDQSQSPSPDLKSLWLQIQVDTSEAGFTQTPYYFAFLCGYGVDNPDRINKEDDVKAVLAERQKSTIFLNHLGFISESSVSGFTYRILRRTSNSPGAFINAAQAEQLQWSIQWIGIEPNSDCPEMPPWFPILRGPLGAFLASSAAFSGLDDLRFDH